MSNETNFNPNGMFGGGSNLSNLENANPDIMNDFENAFGGMNPQETTAPQKDAPKTNRFGGQQKTEQKQDRFATFSRQSQRDPEEFSAYIDKKGKELMADNPDLKARLENALAVAKGIAESMSEKGLKPNMATAQNGNQYMPGIAVSAKADKDTPERYMVSATIKADGSNSIKLFFNRDGSEITSGGVSRALSQKAQATMGKKMEYTPLDEVADNKYIKDLTKEMVQHIQDNGFIKPPSELKQFVKDANEYLKENGSKVQSQSTGQYVSDVYLTHDVREYQGKTYETANMHMHSVDNMIVSMNIGNNGARYMQAVEFAGKGNPPVKTNLTEENFQSFAQAVPKEAVFVLQQFMEQEQRRELSLMESFAIHLNAETFKNGQHVQNEENRTVAIANANYKADNYGEHISLYSRTENGEKTNIVVDLNSNGNIVATDFNNQDENGRYLRLLVDSEETFQQLGEVVPKEVTKAVEEFLDVRDQLKEQNAEKQETKSKGTPTFGNR